VTATLHGVVFLKLNYFIAQGDDTLHALTALFVSIAVALIGTLGMLMALY
jgi:hypothetical protein